MFHCKATLYLLPHHKQCCFILQRSPWKTSDLLICWLKMAFRISKRDFTAVIYPQGPAFVSIRFDIHHCFHIWCIQAFLCSSEIFPISNFRLSYVQFSLIFRWLWHDAFLPPLSAFCSFPLLFLFSLHPFSLSFLDLNIQLCYFNVYSDITFYQGRYRSTKMAENLLQIINKLTT